MEESETEASEIKELDQEPDFILVKKANGRFARYGTLGAVPAQLASSVLTYEDVESKRKEDLETMYSIITGASPKSFPTKTAALDSLVYQILKMPAVAFSEPRPKASPLATGQYARRETRRAPTEFVLSVPEGLGNVVKNLPPQARTVVEALVADAESRGSDPHISEARIHEVLNQPHVKEQLATRQDPARIFQYYRRKIMDVGILREVK